MKLERQPRAFALFVVLELFSSTVSSTWLAAQDYAPLPERLVTAKAAYLVNDSGDLKAYDTFYKELKKWNRFDLVASRDAADIVMVLATISRGHVASSGILAPVWALELRIVDPATTELLWSDSTNKWVTSGHAPSKLVSNLKKRMPRK